MVTRSSDADSTPFVGRDREMAVLLDIIAETDTPTTGLIAGEGGLGKTRLIEEVIARCDSDTTVIRGGAVPRQAPVPFELAHAVLSSLGRGFSQLESSDDTTLVADEIRASAEALRLAREGSTLYIFEDVHWADRESLEVIDRLMVAAPLGATLLITYRPNALTPGLAASSFLQRAERRSHVTQLRLEPLRLSEVASYLESSERTLDDRAVEHVHNRTGGNPLLLSELVASTSNDADLTGTLPWTLAEILRPEIERLDSNLRSVAEAIAVLGTAVGFEFVSAAVGTPEDELLSQLRMLVGTGILVENGPDQFGFRHELVREAVADGLFTRERRRIHAAVHDALIAAGSEDFVALVAHATGAGRLREAADTARAAAHEAMTCGHSHQAMAFAEQALLEYPDDIELLRLAAIAGWLGGQERAGLDHVERWEELLDPGAPERSEVLHHRVRLLWETGNVEAADRAAVQLSDFADELPDGPALAQVLADMAQHAMLSSRDDDALALADRAIEVAARSGPGAASAGLQARVERASVLAGQGLEAGIEELLAVAADAEAAGDHVLASRALHNTPLQPPIADTRGHIERMRRASLRAGLTCIATDGYRQALLAIAEYEGDREAFSTLMEAALEDLGDVPQLIIHALFSAIDDGDVERARCLANRLPVGLETRFCTSTIIAGVTSMIDLAEGNAAPARLWLQSALGDRFTMGLVLRYLSPMLDAGLGPNLAELTKSLGETPLSDPAQQAIVLELSGDREAAARVYLKSAADDHRRPVMEQVEIHIALARLATTSDEDANQHLLSARQVLSAWPGLRRQMVEQMLGRSVEVPRSQTLTPREQQVARLVTQGLTNGGIADELFISTKTASVHVSNILSKLTMGSRTEIAAWVASGGLAA